MLEIVIKGNRVPSLSSFWAFYWPPGTLGVYCGSLAYSPILGASGSAQICVCPEDRGQAPDSLFLWIISYVAGRESCTGGGRVGGSNKNHPLCPGKLFPNREAKKGPGNSGLTSNGQLAGRPTSRFQPAL